MPIKWYNTAILEILGGEGGGVVLANRDIHVCRFPIPIIVERLQSQGNTTYPSNTNKAKQYTQWFGIL